MQPKPEAPIKSQVESNISETVGQTGRDIGTKSTFSSASNDELTQPIALAQAEVRGSDVPLESLREENATENISHEASLLLSTISNSNLNCVPASSIRFPKIFTGKLKELPRYPSMVKWTNSLRKESTARAYVCQFNMFLEKLRLTPELETINPDILIEMQNQLRKNCNEKSIYSMWDNIIRPYIDALPRAYEGKMSAYKAIKSFFACNREPLPRDEQFEIKSDIPPRDPDLSLEDIRKIAQAASVSPKIQSMYLVKVQGFMGEAELEYVNRTQGRKIYLEVMKKTDPIRIDFPEGRKNRRNDPQSRFCTFITKDAVNSLRRYFETERGEVQEGEPVWVSKVGTKTPYSVKPFGDAIRRIVKRLFFKKSTDEDRESISQKRSPKSVYYGKNLHETRDVLISHAHTLKSKGLDLDCPIFFSGRTIDKNKYEKMFLPELQEWVKSQYMLMAPILNVISGPMNTEEALRRREEELQSRYEEMVQEKLRLEERIKQLEEKYETLVGSARLR